MKLPGPTFLEAANVTVPITLVIGYEAASLPLTGLTSWLVEN